MYNKENIDCIKDKMLIRKHTIAVAESVTSGHLQAALSLAENAGLFYQGGITAYNIGQKCRHLNIEPIQAQACNCISEKVAVDMALNVSSFFLSDWGIGVTGYATPDPGNNIEQLFAIYSIAFRGKIIHTYKVLSETRSPLEVQVFYVNKIIEHFADILCSESGEK